MTKIPLMDLTSNFPQIYDEIEEKLKYLIKNTQFIGGEEVKLFEKEYADFCSSKYAIGCSNGTDALVISLKTLGIGPGDIVLVPANSFIATSEAVTQAGARVNFIDVEPESNNMDPQKIREYLKNNKNKKHVKAIIPVHLYGRMANMDEITQIAEEYNLKLIEDSAQAHGALYKSHPPAHFGDFATYSFYPGKNLGAFGDSGALITNNEELYIKAKSYVDHGRMGKKYEHAMEGANMRLDTLQAAILRIKLRYLSQWTEMRINKVGYYMKGLSSINDITLPSQRSDLLQSWHLFVIQTAKRDELQLYLKDRGISTGIHYPIPLHLQPAYKYLSYQKGDFPITEQLSQRILSLPLWPEITEYQIDRICEEIGKFFS
ncbi:MAG: DegT/DnrJ/EryC1/StrS family aminotransferase [Spirochaetaceae bacterium]|jgi:dTDP-4-amino-4,6-dideoxygalactose transaminase|nr:DegT/DnrJ/EryC1/StrS family aminotransferase [Spirochaetaceae bacterium]